ncbi:MAG: amidohydrolase family protein [Alphaproteobacteria bacterium]|nr:amidohydrolase family protein [Alphaproteobacteria bacterium]
MPLLLLLACKGPSGDLDSDAPDWPAEGVVISGARLVDASGVREGKLLVLSGGSIHAVVDAQETPPPRLEQVDLSGATLIPGLIDAHVHLAHSGAPWWVGDTLADNLRATVSFGVVAVNDLGGPTWTFALRDQLRDGALRGPRARVSGPFLTVEGSHPCELRRDTELCRFVEGDGGAQAEALLAEGADAVKAALQDAAFWDHPNPRMDVAELAQICAVDPEAWVHVGADYDAADALDAGCRRLAHVPFGTPAGDEAGLPMDAVATTISAAAGVGRVLAAEDLSAGDYVAVPEPVREAWALAQQNPTALAPGWVEASAAWAALMQANLAVYREAGAPLVAGSDAGYFFVPHGAGLHWELEALVEAGASPAEALAAATSNPAALLGFEDLGFLDAGYAADLLVLDADPLEDIRNTRALREVWLGGQRFTPEELRGEAARLAPGPEGFCLEDGDCAEGLRCDPLHHACTTSCGAPFADLTGCGPESWCAPADLRESEEGICHVQPTCDWRAQDCGTEVYAETCAPRDLDTSVCTPAGPRQPGEACDALNLNLACDEGLYCSPISRRCLELCDPEGEASCSSGTCAWALTRDGEPWFGICG